MKEQKQPEITIANYDLLKYWIGSRAFTEYSAPAALLVILVLVFFNEGAGGAWVPLESLSQYMGHKSVKQIYKPLKEVAHLITLNRNRARYTFFTLNQSFVRTANEWLQCNEPIPFISVGAVKPVIRKMAENGGYSSTEILQYLIVGLQCDYHIPASERKNPHIVLHQSKRGRKREVRGSGSTLKSQATLAEMCGKSRQNYNRINAQLKKKGAVKEIGRWRITEGPNKGKSTSIIRCVYFHEFYVIKSKQRYMRRTAEDATTEVAE